MMVTETYAAMLLAYAVQMTDEYWPVGMSYDEAWSEALSQFAQGIDAVFIVENPIPHKILKEALVILSDVSSQS